MAVSDLANTMRKRQAAAEADELARLIRAYRGIIDNTKDLQDALILEIEAMDAPTVAAVQRLARYKRLIRESEAELQKYQTFVRVELQGASATAISAGEVDARTLVRLAAQGVGVDVSLRTLTPTAIQRLVRFLDPEGPLYKRLSAMPPYTTQAVIDAIINGVGLGRNPRTIAGDLTRAFGMGLTDTMRMMRTVQIYSYREANRASYVANSDVVRGWQWMAELDGSVCASCAVMHGTIHPVEETLDDHYNGRCTMLPVVIGGGAPLDQTGAQWFDSLNEQQQRDLLGGGKYDALQSGKISFEQLSTTRTDEVYGNMRGEPSLKELLGDE